MNAPDDFSPEFQAFGAWVAAETIHRQDVFNDAVGTGNLHADLTTRTLTGERGVLNGVSLLGSFSHLDNTWLWGWANPGFGPDAPAVAATLATRDFGEKHRIAEFTTESPDLSGFPQPAQAAATLAITAGRTIGGHGVWSTAINDGQGHVYLHVDDPQLPVADFDQFATPRLLMAAVGIFPADHRRVVRGYFRAYGLELDETPDRIAGTAPKGAKVLTAFDEHGRLADISVQPG
jgi:hypothetical protein